MALWLAFKPGGIVINNNAVYFNIPASVLLVLALAAYAVCIVIIRLYNYTVAKKEIYMLKILTGEREYKMYAFLDSGNRLVEPFSNYPVIIVDEGKIDFETERVIPYNTVGG